MSNRQTQTRRRQSERGAALVVAIAIMTILLAVALTFYAVSRQEGENATLVRNQIQTGLLVDSALAIAQAELNREFLNNPNATSLDSAAFALFNGSWAVGKQWALWGGTPLQSGGVPLVDLSAMPFIEFGDGYVEQMYSGNRSRGWLTIPRFEGANPVAYENVLDDSTGLAYPYIFRLNDYDRPPFVTPAFYGPSLTDGGVAQRYPLEWIHTWTDVDNDGDGLNDAIWIPLPQDRYFSGGEFRDDLGRRQYEDGLDNDLDGMVDENQEDGVNADGLDEVAPRFTIAPGTPPVDDEDEAQELGSFVYHGLGPDQASGDGLDNDGDGQVDEPDENKLFLTAPLPGLIIPVDLNADGKVPDYVPNGTTGELVVLQVQLPNTIYVDGQALTANDVDTLDNDYDMLINDYNVYAYVGPNTLNGPPFRLQGFVNTGVIDPSTGQNVLEAIENINALNSNAAVAAPAFYDVWRLTGNWFDGDGDRFINARLKAYDEINVDATFSATGNEGWRNLSVFPATSDYWSEFDGNYNTYDFAANLPRTLRITHSGEPVCDLAGRAAITIRDESSRVNVNVAGAHTQNPLGGGLIRSLGDGNSTAEYDTRVLHEIGTGLAYNMFSYRSGRPTDDSQLSTAGANFFNSFNEDIDAPGYGRVDDNANILIAALNRVDDDGDGLVDEGLYLPPTSDPSFAAYYAQLGLFEGVDDPSEAQRFRPLANRLAEGRDPFTRSGFADGDDNDQDGAVNETGELGDLQLQDPLQFQDVDSIGPGIYGQNRQNITPFSTDRNVNFVEGQNGIRAINKLDYNFANPQQIAANLILSNPIEAITANRTFFNDDPTLPAEPNDITRTFANGLRQGNVHIRSTQNARLLGNTVGGFPADPVLQTLQAAVDIVDNRDSDHSRSTLITDRRNRVPQTAALGTAQFDFWPPRLGTRENIAEENLMPLAELESQIHNTLGLNRKLEIRDEWWTFFAVDSDTIVTPTVVGVVGETGLPEERQISYTAAGTEAIKINELMVRPVRRVEAETLSVAPVAPDPMAAVANPANFDPTSGYPQLPTFNVTRAASGPGWVVGNEGHLGDSTYLSLTYDGTNRGNVLEFAFRPSALGLPPGRYYLTVNTTAGVNGNTVTALSSGAAMLEYSIKYVDPTNTYASNSSIIADGLTAFFAEVEDGYLSSEIDGAPNGWAFLPGQNAGAIGDYFRDGFPAIPVVPPVPITAPSTATPTFTVLVPDASTNIELHVAFRINSEYADELDLAGITNAQIAINFFDFSQEPDHEWVELTNTSDQPVDVGGWELEVGIPKAGDDVPEDPFKSMWRVPANTIVGPGGMVLLAFNKYDHYQRNSALDPTSIQPYPGHRVGDNGIGLAVSSGGGFIGYTQSLTNAAVTVPPIGDVSPLLLAGNIYRDPTGSVFNRPGSLNGFIDYIDRDGDGLSSVYDVTPAVDTDQAALEQTIRTSTDGGAGDVNNDGLDDVSGVSMAARPWDRIVEMECLRWTTANPYSPAPQARRFVDIATVDDVAALVLKGGILPNYPEQDGIDNDGDGGYMDANGLYIPGTLERDMVDNNLDGIIDERGIEYNANPVSAPDNYLLNGVDDDGDTVIDEQDEWYLSYNMAASEGVDEGRLGRTDVAFAWRNYGPGSFEEFTLPYVFLNNRNVYNTQFSVPNSNPATMVGDVDGGSGFGFVALNGSNAVINGFVNRLGRYDEPTDPYLSPALVPNNYYIPNITSPYLGADSDPADWKAHAERRWNPGDNVIVTLYEGEASNGKVADRVTYREYDVINRTIDDLVVPNYVNADADESGTVGDTPGDYPVLNRLYTTFWLPNHMALDFYRSLERKHPLYSGDRFGTENRWQATDGNYDDWSDSLSYFEAEIETAAPTEPPLLSSNTLVNGRARFINARQERLFRHAMLATPLRMNSAARKLQNPPDLERVILAQTTPDVDVTQFYEAFDYFRTHEDGDYTVTGTKSLANQTWNLAKAQVANRFFQSPGDLMRVPHLTFLHDAVNTTGGAAYLRDMSMLNIHVRRSVADVDNPSSVQDIALRGATLGQDDFGASVTGNILSAAIDSMSTDSVVLTVGQSEFKPIRPDLTDTTAFPAATHDYILNWAVNPLTTSGALMAPATWSPVFLFAFDSGIQNWDTVLPTSTERFPYYPPYVNGVNITTAFTPQYLFNGDYFLDNQDAAYVASALPGHFEDRLPLERRATMFVSENRPDVAQRAEGLFVWDGEDGLENGEYTLYIGTYVPKLRERVLNAATASGGLISGLPAKTNPELIYSRDNASPGERVTIGAIPVNRVTREILSLDPTHPDVGNSKFESVFALDVITDPTEARGIAPQTGATANPATKPAGLIHPADWNPQVAYRAGSDGYIVYGNNAAGGWRPQTVRVTDNFLAVRIRNMGDPGEVGVITHVVLAPRKRTAGRMNVNTVQSRVVRYDPDGPITVGHEYFNALLGLPGVVDGATSVRPSNSSSVLANGIPGSADIALTSFDGALPANGAWTAPGGANGFYPGGATIPTRNFDRGDAFSAPDTDLLVPPPDPLPNNHADMLNVNDMPEHQLAAYRLTALLMAGRTEHIEGRYYEGVGALADNNSAFDYDYITSEAHIPALDPGAAWYEFAGVENLAVYPLSNESNRGKRFDEVQARLRRMGNLVTVRSDVFEITMTVESGYGVDRDGDGFINYRNREEFVTTGQSKATATYERRSPSDQTDGQE